ncbi:hypothetical protein RND71_040001 [Anisodus tanguticus]|uniref:Uncharacterized protein n=1 Tax=Anisodus tanguticus TaxID=243964 RepID=A0AAE1UYB6_9SOLA|nr:hypothetical protein RND71_040001 [Anisodus tanguticus]
MGSSTTPESVRTVVVSKLKVQTTKKKMKGQAENEGEGSKGVNLEERRTKWLILSRKRSGSVPYSKKSTFSIGKVRCQEVYQIGKKKRSDLGEELSDVLLYLVGLSDICGIDLGKAALVKLELNAIKYPASLCKAGGLQRGFESWWEQFALSECLEILLNILLQMGHGCAFISRLAITKVKYERSLDLRTFSEQRTEACFESSTTLGEVGEVGEYEWKGEVPREREGSILVKSHQMYCYILLGFSDICGIDPVVQKNIFTGRYDSVSSSLVKRSIQQTGMTSYLVTNYTLNLKNHHYKSSQKDKESAQFQNFIMYSQK